MIFKNDTTCSALERAGDGLLFAMKHWDVKKDFNLQNQVNGNIFWGGC